MASCVWTFSEPVYAVLAVWNNFCSQSLSMEKQISGIEGVLLTVPPWAQLMCRHSTVSVM